MLAGWLGILAGLLTGAVIGLFFHEENWQGGYAGWRRRMMRLGHISFFGIGFLNVLFALSVERAAGIPSAAASRLYAAALVAMPAVCFLSAWRKQFRALFFIPVSLLTGACALTVWRLWAI
jgi:hypothetical protein